MKHFPIYPLWRFRIYLKVMSFYNRRIRMNKYLQVLLPVLFVAVVMTWCSAANGQNARVNIFPLNKQFTAYVVVCLEGKDAIAIMESQALEEDAQQKVIGEILHQGKCAPIAVPITYTRLVVRKDIKGEVCSVYEAKIGTETVFIPLKGWTHRVNII